MEKKEQSNKATDAFQLLMKTGNTTPKRHNKSTSKRPALNRPSSTSKPSQNKKIRQTNDAVIFGTSGSPPKHHDRSRFLGCPACGENVLRDRINSHLDADCRGAGAHNEPFGTDTTVNASFGLKEKEEVTVQFDTPRTVPLETCLPYAHLKKEEEEDKPTVSGFKHQNSILDDDDKGVDTAARLQNGNHDEKSAVPSLQFEPKLHTPKSSSSNAFLHMMNSAKKIAENEKPVRRRLHLHPLQNDRVVEVSLQNVPVTDGQNVETGAVLWSDRVTLKQKHERNVELEVTSSVPSSLSHPSPLQGLVRKPSNLSVPVLKSILQKSIRRRRPLPATRIAMELAQKSFGDLLRRLPIIILEDSILHPDLPFLVWLMVSHSKGYAPPLALVKRVMCIVYEVASCPIRDLVDDAMSPLSQNEDGFDITLTGIILLTEELNARSGGAHNTLENIPAGGRLVIQSILLRLHYGGMACDMTMLKRYAHLWLSRYQDYRIPTSMMLMLTTRFTHLRSGNTPPPWWKLPLLLHQPSAQKSRIIVEPIVLQGLEALTEVDACLAGIDFHCSRVLRHIGSDSDVQESIMKELDPPSSRGGVNTHPHGTGNDTGGDQRDLTVSAAMKHAMWKYSSGLNFKSFLYEKDDKTESDTAGEDEAALERIWKDVLSLRVEAFAKKYVSDRLIRRDTDQNRGEVSAVPVCTEKDRRNLSFVDV